MTKRFKTIYVEGDNLWNPGYSAVVEILDDGTEREVGSDGGEPEDQTLYRKWAWVVDALNKAYEDGYETASKLIEQELAHKSQ